VAKRRPTAASFDAECSDFYERVFPQVYSFLRSQAPRAEVAQEQTSSVFLKACRHWPHAPRGEAATFWVFRIARTTLIDYWRVEGRRDAANASLDELAEASDGGADPERLCAAKERSRAVVRAASTLGETDRVLIALKFAAQRSISRLPAFSASAKRPSACGSDERCEDFGIGFERRDMVRPDDEGNTLRSFDPVDDPSSTILLPEDDDATAEDATCSELVDLATELSLVRFATPERVRESRTSSGPPRVWLERREFVPYVSAETFLTQKTEDVVYDEHGRRVVAHEMFSRRTSSRRKSRTMIR
jgi:RNA polymerase sigma factor (sigma-70 family)